MKNVDSTTAESKSANKHVQTKKKVECQHFSIRGYAADMRQTNPTVGNPFANITDTRWKHFRPALGTPHFRCWDFANCVREIGISRISTNLPDLMENSRTSNEDKNGLLKCPSDPDKDSLVEHTVAKGHNKCVLEGSGVGGSSRSTLSGSCDELYMRAVDQTVTCFPKHQDESLLPTNKVRSLTQDLIEKNSELLPDHPLAEQIQHNLNDVTIGSPNDIYKTDVPEKVKLVELPNPSSSSPRSMKRKLISVNLQKRLSKKRKRVHPKMLPNNEEEIKLLKRGCVTMHRIMKREIMATKQTVSFNAKGEAFGPEAVEMQSYIGVLARTKAPICHKSWKQVTAKTKNEVWDCVQMAFVVPPTAKTLVLNSACQKWREFKSRLTRKYVLPYREQCEKLVHPPADYPFIKKSHWDMFVASRVSDKYLEIHKVQKMRGKKNLYPQRSSRRGYANIINEWSESHPEVKIDRSTARILARKGKDGNFRSEAVKRKAKKIKRMKQQVNEETVVEEGTHDVQTMVLGNPEHPGRVRGQGSHVKQSVDFDLPRQKKVMSIDDKFREGVQKVWAEEAAKIIKERDAFWLAEVEKLKKEILAKTQGHGAS